MWGAGQPQLTGPCGVGPVIPPLRSSSWRACHKLHSRLPPLNFTSPSNMNTVNGPEIECKIKMQQIHGCKSHLEPIIGTTSRLCSRESPVEAELVGHLLTSTDP